MCTLSGVHGANKSTQSETVLGGSKKEGIDEVGKLETVAGEESLLPSGTGVDQTEKIKLDELTPNQSNAEMLGESLWKGLFGEIPMEGTGPGQVLLAEVYQQTVGQVGNGILTSVLGNLGPGETLVSIGSHVDEIVENPKYPLKDQQLPDEFLEKVKSNKGTQFHLVLVDGNFSDGEMPLALQDGFEKPWSLGETLTFSEPVPEKPGFTFTDDMVSEVEYGTRNAVKGKQKAIEFINSSIGLKEGVVVKEDGIDGLTWEGDIEVEVRVYQNKDLPNLKVIVVPQNLTEEIWPLLSERSKTETLDFSGYVKK